LARIAKAIVEWLSLPQREAKGPAEMSGSGSPAAKYGDAEWAQQFLGHIIHSCTVLVCKPYRPSKEEQEDPELYKANVRQLMLQRLQELQEQESRQQARSPGEPEQEPQ